MEENKDKLREVVEQGADLSEDKNEIESKPKKKKKGGMFYTVLMLLCAVVFLFALYKVVDIILDYKAIDDYYDAAVEEYVETDDDGRIKYIDLAKLVAKNKDVKGWIYIEDTDINYPILQGTDNDFYLYRNYDKEWIGAGSIFIDAANAGDYSDSHTIIYGHNMHNGSMFGKMDKFMEQEYRDEHPYVYIMRLDGKWDKYEIYSAYIAGVDDGTFKVFTNDDEAYKEYVELTMNKNLYTGMKAPTGERVLTLSTCTEDSDDFKRFVLQTKLVDTVEKIGNDKNKADEKK